jgi:hypothetical protein
LRHPGDDPDYEVPEFSYRTRRQTAAFDPTMRRIALGAGGIATLVIIVALVWSGMKPGLGFGPPPVITAPPGPLRVVPANPGGLNVPEADEQIMSGASSNAPAQLAPDGTAPDLSAFQPPPPAPPPPAAAQGASPSAPSAPASPTAPAPATASPDGSSALAPTASPPPPIPVDNNILVQLAAAVDPAGPRQAWHQLNAKMPALFSGHTPIYSHADVAGVEFWRLRMGGFTDIAAAHKFCAAVKAQGAACTVAAF